MRSGAAALAVLLGLGALGLSACSPAGRESAASRAAGRFVAAVGEHDGATACALLTDKARESVSGATRESCPEAIVNVEEHGVSVRRVQVWGDSAQVRIGSDVVFLLRQRVGWRVTAAGCQAQPHAPYQCDVEG